MADEVPFGMKKKLISDLLLAFFYDLYIETILWIYEKVISNYNGSCADDSSAGADGDGGHGTVRGNV